MDYKEKLKILNEHGYTWFEIARKIKKHHSSIWKWRHGIHRPNKNDRRKIHRLYKRICKNNKETETCVARESVAKIPFEGYMITVTISKQ
ncbi:hypothetical protein ACFL6F_01040 [Planctomycetota bacterium]